MMGSNRVILALALAIVLGLLVAASGNSAALRFADLVAPIGALWVNAIRMTVIPLIVSLLITGVASTAGSAVGRLGVRSVIVFVLLSSLLAVVMIPLITLAFNAMPAVGARPT